MTWATFEVFSSAVVSRGHRTFRIIAVLGVRLGVNFLTNPFDAKSRVIAGMVGISLGVDSGDLVSLDGARPALDGTNDFRSLGSTFPEKSITGSS